jgi:hypothetical protein
MPNIRKEMPDVGLTRAQFAQRMHERFHDPAFAPLRQAVDSLIDVAWDAYEDSRKADVRTGCPAGISEHSLMSVSGQSRDFDTFFARPFFTQSRREKRSQKFCARKECLAMSVTPSISTDSGETRNDAQCH